MDAQLAKLDPKNKAEKKKITALNKDKAALEARLAKTDAILAAIGGQLTEVEARELILKKLYDLVTNELNALPQCRKAATYCRGGKSLGQIRRFQPRTGRPAGRNLKDAGGVSPKPWLFRGNV